MAHVALIVDSDPGRRREFTTRVETLFRDLPRAKTHSAAAGDMMCLWSCGDTAPVSLHRDGDSLAVLIGYAIDDAGQWLTAKELAERWLRPQTNPEAFDGYHVGLVYDAKRGLVTGVDPFGLFPFYFAELGTKEDVVFLASSTPEAISAHPRFRSAIDRAGLAGILFGHGLIDNRPLLAGIRRAPTGHHVRWTKETGCEQVATYHPANRSPSPEESPTDLRRRIGAEFVRAIHRHRPGNAETTMLLSGGLDSRLVAASLVESGIPTRALILGEPDDHEVIAGRSVARQLGLPHEVISTESFRTEFASAAHETVRFGHLSSAPSPDDFADALAVATPPGSFFWSGMMLDWIFDL